MCIRKAVQSDIVDVARVHKERFSDHFLGKFPLKIIERYYLSYVADDNILFIVHVDENNKVDGFVMGGFSQDIKEAASNFIRHNLLLLMGVIVITPKVWKDVLDRLKILFRKDGRQKNKEVGYSDIRLLSIAVAKEKEGKGVSTSLVKNFEKGVENIGGKRYGLSVHDDNIHALNFYTKMGFIKDAQTGNLVLMTKNLMMEESVIRKR